MALFKPEGPHTELKHGERSSSAPLVIPQRYLSTISIVNGQTAQAAPMLGNVLLGWPMT